MSPQIRVPLGPEVMVASTPVGLALKQLSGPVVLQYDWTWTHLVEPSWGSDDAPAGLGYTTKAPGLAPMQILVFDEAASAGAVKVLYAGEKPRLLGAYQKGAVNALGNSAAEPVYEMLAKRMKAALDDTSQRYFLMQELEFHPEYGPLEWTTDRMERLFGDAGTIRRVRQEILEKQRFRDIKSPATSLNGTAGAFQGRLMAELSRRCVRRGMAEPPPRFTPLGLGDKDYLIGLTNVFRGVLGGEGEDVLDRTHNEFAAGNLVIEGTVPGVKGLVDKDDGTALTDDTSRSGEPDSSAVMLYAELALAMYENGLEHSGDALLAEAGDFWVKLLNSTVQMQAVYLHRHSRGFTGCDDTGMSRPAPSADYEKVVRQIREFRGGPKLPVPVEDEVKELRQRMRCHAMYLMQYQDRDSI